MGFTPPYPQCSTSSLLSLIGILFPHSLLKVLHHIVQPGPDYSQVEKFIQESYRVLVPKGALIIQVSSNEQYATYWYYYDIIPEAADRLKERYADRFKERYLRLGVH